MEPNRQSSGDGFWNLRMKRLAFRLWRRASFRSVKALWCGGLLAMGFFTLRVGAVDAGLVLDRETIEAGETFGLQVVVEGTQRTGQPTLPAIPGVRSRYLGPTSQMESINGQTSVKVVHRFLLKPDTTNDVEIPPIPVRVGNQTITTAPGKVRVLPFEGHDEMVWAKLILDRDEVMVGDTFPVELQLYYQSIRDPSAPRFDLDGFVIGRSSQPSQAVTQRGDQSWSLVIWRFAVTATKPGELSVGPAEIDLTLLLATPGQRRTGSLMDDFFGPPREARRLTVKTQGQKVRAIAPPAVGRPAGFAGAVGRFRMGATVSPAQLTVGDPATVRITVEGRGGIERLDMAPWPENPAFRVYPGTNGFVAGDALGLEGTKVIESIVVPERAGTLRLAVPSLVYFDPDSRRYQTATAPALILQVKPATNALAGNASAQANGASGTNGPGLTGSAPVLEWRMIPDGAPILGIGWSGKWVAAVASAPWLAWIGASLVGEVRRRRAQRPAGPIRDRWLAESRSRTTAGTTTDPATELAQLSRAVRCWLAWWLDQSPDGISSGVIEESLRPRGMPPEACAAVAEWFEAYETLRFAPGSPADLAEFRLRTEALLARLRQEERQ
jgi:hypothetical protein